MFTGIIEETGVIAAIPKGVHSAQLKVSASLIFDDLKIGDSVAVNGVCLTVTEINRQQFTADVMNETLSRSNLGDLHAGNKVNLERAMPAYGRFGGHIVSGHIDGTGKIIAIERDDNAIWLTVSALPPILKYIVEKGSIAIDGISLTVAKVANDDFAVSIIPHTATATTLLDKKVGDTVNLENDIVGKYVEKLYRLSDNQHSATSKITAEFLAQAGF